MPTERDTRESEASFFVLKKMAKTLRLRKGGEYHCPCPNCEMGIVKIFIKADGEKCCVTALCEGSSPECDFPTLSGPINWDYEGESD
jgi:hypothetical protein